MNKQLFGNFISFLFVFIIFVSCSPEGADSSSKIGSVAIISDTNNVNGGETGSEIGSGSGSEIGSEIGSGSAKFVDILTSSAFPLADLPNEEISSGGSRTFRWQISNEGTGAGTDLQLTLPVLTDGHFAVNLIDSSVECKQSGFTLKAGTSCIFSFTYTAPSVNTNETRNLTLIYGSSNVSVTRMIQFSINPGAGFYKLQPNLTLYNQVPDCSINSIFTDTQNIIYVGCKSNGIFVLTPEYNGVYSVKNITTQDGLASNFIWSTYTDAKGVIFAATDNGLSIITKQPNGVFSIRNLTNSDGLARNNLLSVFADINGIIYVGSDTGLIILKPLGNGNYAVTNSGDVNGAVWNFGVDASSVIYLVQSSNLVTLTPHEDGTYEVATVGETLASGNITRIVVGSDNSIYIVTDNGLSILTKTAPGTYSVQNMAGVFASANIRSIYLDSHINLSNLYLGTDHGISILTKQGDANYSAPVNITSESVGGLNNDILSLFVHNNILYVETAVGLYVKDLP